MFFFIIYFLVLFNSYSLENTTENKSNHYEQLIKNFFEKVENYTLPEDASQYQTTSNLAVGKIK